MITAISAVSTPVPTLLGLRARMTRSRFCTRWLSPFFEAGLSLLVCNRIESRVFSGRIESDFVFAQGGRRPLVPPAESNRVANPRRDVNQRFREFRAEISGFGSNLYGWFRASVGVSRNGDFPASGRMDVNPCGKGKKRETPGGRNLGVGR